MYLPCGLMFWPQSVAVDCRAYYCKRNMKLCHHVSGFSQPTARLFIFMVSHTNHYKSYLYYGVHDRL